LDEAAFGALRVRMLTVIVFVKSSY